MRADPRTLWMGAGAGLGVAALLAYNGAVQPWTVDDAYISFRYAEHFARGEGMVYNPGERVEGYTTFLWVLLLGSGHALGLPTRAFAKALGLSLAVLCVALLAASPRLVGRIPPRAAGVAAALLGASPSFGVWAMTGMEVTLVAALLLGFALAATAALDGRRGAAVAAGVLGALALMARPDSVLWVAVGCGALLLGGGGWRGRLVGPLVVAGLYGPYFLARAAYYGWWLPNTFYAKVGASPDQLARGVDYVSAFPTAEPVLVLFALPSALLIRRWPRIGALWVGALAHAAYVASVGGDVFPAFRFLAGGLPLLALLAGLGLDQLAARGGRVSVAPLALAMALLLGQAQLRVHPELLPRIERGVVGLRGEEVGRWLADNVPPGFVIATNTAGSVPYFSGLRAIDMLGLNDEHIAHREMPGGIGGGLAGHEKADGAYVFARRPELVHLGSARGRKNPVFRSDRELVAQRGFADTYVARRYALPSGASLWLWVRRDVEGAIRSPPQPDGG